MSAYELSRVLEKWDREELTADQAIGQLLLLVESLNRRVGGIERRLERMRVAAAQQATGPPKEQLSLGLEGEKAADPPDLTSSSLGQTKKDDDVNDGPARGGAVVVGPRPLVEQMWLA